MSSPRLLELVEYEDASYEAGEIAEKQGQYLHQRFSDKVTIEPPTFKTEHRWHLKSSG